MSYERADGGSWIVAAALDRRAAPDLAIDVNVKEGMNEPPMLIATDNRTKASRVVLGP
jgi:hypothetical protein